MMVDVARYVVPDVVEIPAPDTVLHAYIENDGPTYRLVVISRRD